jgi:iron-sulfur cluster assembly protein
MVTLQTETPTGASASTAPAQPHAPAAPASPVLTAVGETSSKTIQVTVRALRRIRAAMAKEGISPAAGGLRVGITGGGCSGLSYNIRFDTQPRDRDRVYAFPQAHLDSVSPEPAPAEAPPLRLFVDPKSYLYLAGMILDYEETLMRQGFNFINPNSTKSCGCGSSFSA